ncbi:MAG: peptide chain release factor 1 [Candidatus Omnitrophica bacterium]|nr:peptide chain release factor 1 [Candidatus Omnitrophota bacterium]
MIKSEKLKEEYARISQQLSFPDVIKDRVKYAKLTKRFSYLEKVIKLLDERDGYLKEEKHLENVISDPREDQEMKKLAQEELGKLKGKLEEVKGQIEDKIFAENELDHDLIMEIRSAAGGEESALFAATLFKMYSKYAERNNWKVEILSSSPTGIGGLKEVIFSFRGKGAYRHLKLESGVHRVQRVPVTESGGRVHTSTVTVAVLIEPKDVELKINPEDLRIDTFRSSGAGGQHVNVTDSAVRMTHLPTGIVVACQDERSQIKNRAKALRVIKARIMEKMLEAEASKVSQNRRAQVGTGDRSEKIRTYNYSERRITDHRINFTIYRLEEVLEGDLGEIADKLIREERKKIYEAKELA